jgi:hypothetical protein
MSAQCCNLTLRKQPVADIDLADLAFTALHSQDTHGHSWHQDPTRWRAQPDLPGAEVEQIGIRTPRSQQCRACHLPKELRTRQSRGGKQRPAAPPARLTPLPLCGAPLALREGRTLLRGKVCSTGALGTDTCCGEFVLDFLGQGRSVFACTSLMRCSRRTR